ncbi:MAG: hypothetical protein ACJARP_003032 [Vicingaceae bacterium]
MAERCCHNCYQSLKKRDVYCRNCGQKVDENNLSIKAIFHEFIENYLSFDTKMGRTMYPFLFRPGYLVAEFIKGHRASYVNPFRFYLLISIFFFFVLGVYVDHSVIDPRSKNFSNEATTVQDGKKEASGLVTDLENFAMLLDSLKSADSLFVQNNMDSLIAAHQLNESITFNIDTTARSKDTATSFVKINSSGLGFNINTTRLAPLKEYRYDRAYSDKALLDSVQSSGLGKSEVFVALQAIKLYRSDARVITRFTLGNFSLSMVILIPGLAFFFFLFYYKQRKPFVAHLIHSLYFHTFSLFIYALAILVVFYFESTGVVFIAFLISAVHLFFSLKRVYPKSRFSTLWRFISIGILYYFYWTFTTVLGFILSFLLF